jgi:hypothetical protein
LNTYKFSQSWENEEAQEEEQQQLLDQLWEEIWTVESMSRYPKESKGEEHIPIVGYECKGSIVV